MQNIITVIMHQAAIDFKTLNATVGLDTKLTPMMQQYFEIKAQYQDCLLFYRLGDFYELFFEDAVLASQTLDIVLTKRGKGTDNEVPMCGVPAHSHEFYLKKLIEAGFKVAICNQLETPEEAKKRGAKSVVRREVTRIITPGTIIEETLLSAKKNSYLCAVVSHGGKAAISWLDITTGEFYTSVSVESQLFSDLQRLSPAEIIISERYANAISIYSNLPDLKRIITPRPSAVFDLKRAENTIETHFKVISAKSVLTDFTEAQIVAIGAMLEYVLHTQKSAIPLIKTPKNLKTQDCMQIDPSSMKNLEIFESITGDRKNSLHNVLDETLTAGGGRLLNFYLACPLLDVQLINERLDVVEFMITNFPHLQQIIPALKEFPDIERNLAKIFLNKATPRDLEALKKGLAAVQFCLDYFKFNLTSRPSLLDRNLNLMSNFGNLHQSLCEALADEIPAALEDGCFIKAGYNSHLDELYRLKDNAAQELEKLRDKYRSISMIANLKITKNNVIGYFIEVTPGNKAKIDESLFRLKQATGSSLRYTTQELQNLEQRLESADGQIRALEQNIFNELCKLAIDEAEVISCAAQSIAFIDVFLAFAKIALDNKYVRPELTNDSTFVIHGGRHPVIETLLQDRFIANDSYFSTEETIKLITGPNMAGKSTYMRQNAIITIMAQIGCYVPAKSAKIGLVDKLFSRIGAGDDISRGHSTFMVEMLETANIIKNATARSLIILDEIGRGTATYDGLSIAWAVLEDIHNRVGARTLFATHYHELTALEKDLSKLVCYNLLVEDEGNEVIFLHRIERGRADRSYGIHVAQLAGLPTTILNRASEILTQLVNDDSADKINQVLMVSTPASAPANDELITKIKQLDLDSLTPREAFNFLYELKNYC